MVNILGEYIKVYWYQYETNCRSVNNNRLIIKFVVFILKKLTKIKIVSFQ